MFPQVKQLRQADEGELSGKGGRRTKLNVSGHVGRSGIRKGGRKREKGGSREKCHRHEKKFCGRSSICPGLLKRRSKGGQWHGTDGERGTGEKSEIGQEGRTK